MTYVEQREAEIKAAYRMEMWWIGISKLWDKLGKVMVLKREADYHTAEFNKIRSQYIKRGRVAGSKVAA